MTREQYNRIVKRTNATNDNVLYKDLLQFFTTGGFVSVEQKSHFMSQICHESNNLSRLTENLNYSSAGLLRYFGKYFNSVTAKQYARKPTQIANRVYANRMENGDEASGDGWRFRGASPMQLTGRRGFRLCSEYLKLDLITDPEFARTLTCAIAVCDYYWTTNAFNTMITGLPKDDDVTIYDNVKKVTLMVNGGTNGLSERTALYKRCKAILLS